MVTWPFDVWTVTFAVPAVPVIVIAPVLELTVATDGLELCQLPAVTVPPEIATFQFAWNPGQLLRVMELGFADGWPEVGHWFT